jgi:hypothetical protein
LKVLGAIQGAVCHERGRAIGRLARLNWLGDDLPNVLPVAALAAEEFHEERNAGLVLYHELQHDLGAVWTMSAAVATGAVNHLCRRLRSPGVAAIDMTTGAIERGTGRSQPQALGRGVGNKTIEFRAPGVIEPIPGASPRVIMKRLGINPGGDETRRRCVLKTYRPEIAWLVHKTKPLEESRCDGAALGDKAGLWRMLRHPVESGANTQFVQHPGDPTKRLQDFTPGRSGPRCLLSA